MAMSMDRIIGRMVGLILNNTSGLEMAGHDQKVHRSSFLTRVVDFDEFGLWAESRYRKIMTYVYLPWGNIKSIIFFPEKHDIELDVESQNRCLGFGCRAETTAKLPRIRVSKKRSARRQSRRRG